MLIGSAFTLCACRAGDDLIEQRLHRLDRAARDMVRRGKLRRVVGQQHRRIRIPAGIRIFRDEVHRRQKLVVLDIRAGIVFADRNACHAAEHVFGLCLVGEEVSERVENRYLPSVFRHQNTRGLDDVRVPADDEIRAAVGQNLRPGFLIVVRPERVLFSPVGKDDDKIRSFLCPGKIGLDRVKRHKAVDHPRLSRRAAIETVGVVQHRDTDAVFLDHAKGLRVFF